MDKNTLYRCQYCNRLIFAKDIAAGSCQCGSRKVRPAFGVTQEELDEVKKRGFIEAPGQFTATREEAWLD